ncbi:MAG: nicotinamide-nucleotide amidohydrolase family protein [Spiroplasma sp.]|nr:nicotinamide-nucleotide amidohydrolase family protein [Spiroplasma sp.]
MADKKQATNDTKNLTAKIIKLLKDASYTISSCESITGGFFSKTITDFPGASQVFKGAIIAYDNEIKIKVVKVKPKIINKFGAISRECALAMAKNIKKIFKTDIGISFTGNAGPDNLENKPSGLVYLAIVLNKKQFWVEELHLVGYRDQIRVAVIKKAQELLLANLINLKNQ